MGTEGGAHCMRAMGVHLVIPHHIGFEDLPEFVRAIGSKQEGEGA